MKKWTFLLCIFLLIQSLSGCRLSTVDDLPIKDETIDTFRQHRDLFYMAVEELQTLWQSHSPHSLSIDLMNTKLYVTIYHFAEDGYHLKKSKSELESETLTRLLSKVVTHGIHMDMDGIDFQCSGAGFGPNTAYSGVFYSATGKLSDIPFLPSDLYRLSDPDRFSSSREGGDNEVEIERIEGGFFYYRLRY